ncbi:leucine-rich repeat domain-containing protein [Pseudomonas putida]|uniref:leucine-rich repeat domain-containing protein n=1 Tax=Pseudomonas putida TaxID=303 RepID=UPI0009A20FD2|nr:leucine-rich repeat domain-containing protein [Pseudomonas putida]
MTTSLPFHHTQIVNTLPTWSKDLHPAHASRILHSLRKEYLDADGKPYDWYTDAPDLDQLALRRAIKLRDASRLSLHNALVGLKGITEFCKPLLQARLGTHIPVDQAQYVYQATRVSLPGFNPGTPPVPGELRPVVPDGAPQPRSLLEAALHNFEGENDTTRHSHLQVAIDDSSSIPGLSLDAFIKHCRALDLGQHYQSHLASVFEGEQAGAIKAHAIKARQDELRVQTRIARLRNQLSPSGIAALHTLCANIGHPSYADKPLHCWRISLFGIALHEWMVIGPDAPNTVNPVILYLPGSDTPLQEFESAQQAYSHLSQRLLDNDFFNLTSAQAPHALQPSLTIKLRRALYITDEQPRAARAKPHLELSRTLLPAQPWVALETLHVQRLKADARVLVVPTADVDATARLERLEHWLDIGLTVLNVAAMFIPGLNPIMMTIGAAQIMGSVFHGIEAWEEGDNAEALAQLESILLNVGTVAVIGGSAVALKASGFVDEMQSIIKDGKKYLWSARSEGYASSHVLPETMAPDERGLYTLDERHYARMDTSLYEMQASADGQWRVAHPQDASAYPPRASNYGEGAWRMEHEQPLDWDEAQLVRRLGPISEGLQDADMINAMRATGTEADVLRRIHIAEQRPPSLFADALDRLHCDAVAEDIILRILDGRPLVAYKNYVLAALPELPGWPVHYAIKAFNGPEPWGAFTLYGGSGAITDTVIEVTITDLEAGKLGDIVADALDEQAADQLLPMGTSPALRAQVLNGRLADHLMGNRASLFESLYLSRRLPLSSEAQTLGRQFPGLPRRALEALTEHATPSERQRMSAGRVPLRVAEEARLLQADVRLDRALLGMNHPTLVTADTQKLIEALQAEHPGATNSELFDIACADRPHAATLIGQQPIKPSVRSPARTSDGRVGYPLSGRNQSSSWWRARNRNVEDRRLQELYPRLTMEQRGEMLETLRARSRDVGAQIDLLSMERAGLAERLENWVSQANDEQRADRQRFSQQIKEAWRQDEGATLTLEEMNITTLPPLLARFDHITHLEIDNLGLQQIPADFLPCFPNLKSLRIARNPQLAADSLFDALASFPKLETLELPANGFGELSETARANLGNLRGLRTLNLRGNPLVRSPNLAQMNFLKRLDLSDCGLTEWPEGLTALMSWYDFELLEVDLSANQIGEVPALEDVLATPFTESLLHRQDMEWLFGGNPIDENAALQLKNAGVGIDINRLLINTSPARRALWSKLFGGSENLSLKQAVESLSVLPESATEHVWGVLEGAGLDRDLLTYLNDLSDGFQAFDHNAAADCLSTLHVEADTYALMISTETTTDQLYLRFRQLYRRALVNRRAERIAGRRYTRQTELLERQRRNLGNDNAPPLDDVDDIDDDVLLRDNSHHHDMRLALRTSLHTALDFPEPGPDLDYEPPVSLSTEQNVTERVKAADLQAQPRRDWVAEHTLWKHYVTKRLATSLNERWGMVTDYLDSALDAQTAPALPQDPDVLEALGRAIRAEPAPRVDEQGNVLPAPASPFTGTHSPFDEQGQLQPFTVKEWGYNFAYQNAGTLYIADELALSKRTIVACDPDQP